MNKIKSISGSALLFEYDKMTAVLKENERTKSGIIVPEGAKDAERLLPSPIFTIDKVGPRVTKEGGLKAGVKVIINHNSTPMPIKVSDTSYMIYQEHDVIAIIE